MTKYAFWFRRLGLKLALFVLLALPGLAGAQQYFTFTQTGDVDAGFRKTGSFADAYEGVVYLGNISNFMVMPAGATTNFIFFTNQVNVTMCSNLLGNLQWSVFSFFSVGGSATKYTNDGYVWPEYTTWYTVPRTIASTQTTPPPRLSFTDGGNLQGWILGVSSGANALSLSLAAPTQQGNTNADNNFQLILEPTADASEDDNLTHFIGDPNNTALGDFNAAVSYAVENVNSNSFTAAAVSDFYVNVPIGTAHTPSVDPITGQSTGNADYLGFFTYNLNGTVSFTRAAAVTPPSAGTVTASVTNGFGPLTVTFGNTASGSITNWVWNFGNGTTITNTTSGTVSNTYTTAGSYTVTLTVYGPGGSSMVTVANFIVTSPAPSINLAVSSKQLVFSGTNCPTGVQYRILTSTNLTTTLASWKPIYTNTFGSNGSFSYTNLVGGTNSFFILVSP